MLKKNFLPYFVVVFAMMLSSFAFYTYQILYTPNILVEAEDQYFSISKGTTFKEFQNNLDKGRYVNDLVSFSFLAKLKKLDRNLKPGMYQLKKDMTNLDAINMFRSGAQVPVMLTFTSSRTLQGLPKKLSKGLEIDSTEVANILLADDTPKRYGFDKENFISMFLPDSYQVYWTATTSDLLDRMKKEYEDFWNVERGRKAKELNLMPLEVSTLASIVQSETNKLDEASTIAGVYLNRLKRGIALQADPTVIFAIGDFSIRRVLNKDKDFDSPYNTYKYKGLPPGPIRMAEARYIDAVLNAENHTFLYFCAKDDFSGYHVFAKTLSEHNINARKFQRALNKEKIYR